MAYFLLLHQQNKYITAGIIDTEKKSGKVDPTLSNKKVKELMIINMLPNTCHLIAII